MGRRIIFGATNTAKPSELRVVPPISVAQLSKADLDRRLRMKRARQYVEAMTRLDAGGHLENSQVVEALIAAIQAELPEVTIDELPIGIVARCYLGNGYEVHTLDRTGGIVQHYKTHQSLPALLERARSLALHPQYDFVEVYVNSLIAVRNTGEASLVTI